MSQSEIPYIESQNESHHIEDSALVQPERNRHIIRKLIATALIGATAATGASISSRYESTGNLRQDVLNASYDTIETSGAQLIKIVAFGLNSIPSKDPELERLKASRNR